MLALPVRSAFADGQVLELPQVRTASVTPPTSSEDDLVPSEPAPRHRSARQEVADSTPPPGVGSLADYMREGEDDSPYPSSFSSYSSSAPMPMSPAAMRFDPNGDRNAMVNNVILGALALGLFAYEIHAAHQHHRR